MNEKKISQLIQDIYEGITTVESLPLPLYEAISKRLLSGFSEFGGTPSKALLAELTQNIYMFSAAKTYHQINDIVLMGEGGTIKSFAAFKAEALKIYDQYNVNWLATEYATTVATGQSIVRWNQIQDQKGNLPYLQYSAVIDKNTSPICAPLDGICLPVNHSFWNKNAPLNHFNCRCTLIQLDKYDAIITPEAKANEAEEAISKARAPMFEKNSGAGNVIFNKDHPYFKVPEKDKALAKANFGLPIPEIKKP